jgi:hypothetical protein
MCAPGGLDKAFASQIVRCGIFRLIGHVTKEQTPGATKKCAHHFLKSPVSDEKLTAFLELESANRALQRVEPIKKWTTFRN